MQPACSAYSLETSEIITRKLSEELDLLNLGGAKAER